MNTIRIFGVIFALLSVILGAFASHLLKKIISQDALNSFEIGIKYMMYHGIALLVLSILPIEEKKWVARFFVSGTFLFSFSIFFLSLQSILKIKFWFLGPVTPIGGALLIFGWILLLYKSL